MATKENKTLIGLPILKAEELTKGTTYFSNESHLVKIKEIWPEKKEMWIYNMSEQYHQLVPFNRHNLVKVVR